MEKINVGNAGSVPSTNTPLILNTGNGTGQGNDGKLLIKTEPQPELVQDIPNVPAVLDKLIEELKGDTKYVLVVRDLESAKFRYTNLNLI